MNDNFARKFLWTVLVAHLAFFVLFATAVRLVHGASSASPLFKSSAAAPVSATVVLSSVDR